jgi:TetR/AcrR family transcriptional repressor of bet genes
MGRPTVSAERTAQIYDATIACIKRYGAGGTTLERIAATAGMSRGHVRHFVGNRDQLMVDAARHFYGIYQDRHPWRGADGEPFGSIDAVFDYLFGEAMTEPNDDNVFVHELVDASRTNPELAKVLVDAYGALRNEIGAALAADAPGADPRVVDEAAYGILCVALGNVFISEIDLTTGRSSISRFAATAILGEFRRVAT